ncbi:MAG TPA: phosphoribosylformylglycinamidine synthase subunit PurL [Candidatus Poseidoniales archaeon]|jgi:phosphoribosylformylglycinamidine synthase|nr:phosphoribosylformylglycinamidine synthase subunit PurL [Candidatus Poseidoniales archaeon]
MRLQPLAGVEQAFAVPLDGDLEATGEALGLGLSLAELEKVRDHFRGEGRVPTDVELQAIDQAWSEHCCYKSSRPVLEETVFDLDVPRKVAVREDAGIMEFDDDHYYAVGLESHNHPSALDPYGGAATGIGGILRDVVCMGAQPIALVDPLFFGELDTPRSELPDGVKHPRYLMGGVVAGIRDYGNRVGIPTVAGQVAFHPGYTGNPLVNVGCIGIMPKSELIHSRAGGTGDIYILAGGRTGRDGIHGVTFASRELEAGSESDIGAVQLGDPITKEPLMHLCLELNRAGLLTGMKDLGGGGLSCVVGELALDGGCGARVDLERVPLKQPGMAPWEIWVSESQERMMFTVRPEEVAAVLERCAAWDVEATTIGEVVPQKRTRVDWHGTTVLDLDLEFTTGGPAYRRPSLEPEAPTAVEVKLEQPADIGALLLELLATPELGSREWVIRQYDHQVRGATALNPLQGPVGREGPGDAAVLKPVPGSWRGLALTSDVSPWLMEADPRAGTLLAIAEVCGNLAAVGARIDSLADCLCFGNPQKPEIMGQFRAACEALAEGALALGVPYVSGNVSFYNETPQGAIPPTPVLMGVGIVEDIRNCVTSDLKAAGELWLIGPTGGEMGASLIARHLGAAGGALPPVDFATLVPRMEALVMAIGTGEVVACHDLSAGGLAVALAEMCLSGNGAAVELPPELDAMLALFSETPGRWLVQVTPGCEASFTARFDHAVRLGAPAGKLCVTREGKTLLSHAPAALRTAWETPLAERLA